MSTRVKTSLAALATIVATGLGSPASASTPSPPVLTVGVMPVASYARATEDIYQERPAVGLLRQQVGVWQRRIEKALARLDGVSVHRTSELQSRIVSRRGREALEVGRERYALGLERYRGLHVEKAVAHLRRARELFEAAYVDVAEPREVADAALYEGLASMESGPQSHALVAFRRMWTLDPGRSFDRGYYPSTTEQVLEAAFADLLTAPDIPATRWPAKRLQSLGPIVGVDLWLTAIIIGPVEAPSLRVRAYDVSRESVTLDETFQLDDLAEDRLDRVLSAWHACQIDLVPVSAVRPKPRPAWYIDASYAHTLMLHHSNTRDLFQSPGLAVSLTWEALDFLHGYTQFSYMGSLPDPNGDLIKPFLATRLALGGGLTGGSRHVRGFFRLGFEIAISLTDIEMTQNPACKHWGTDDELRCDKSEVFVDESPGTWFGIVLGAGVRWKIVDAWYFVGALEFASYFADAESELIDDLNFPLSVSFGVGARF